MSAPVPAAGSSALQPRFDAADLEGAAVAAGADASIDLQSGVMAQQPLSPLPAINAPTTTLSSGEGTRTRTGGGESKSRRARSSPRDSKPLSPRGAAGSARQSSPRGPGSHTSAVGGGVGNVRHAGSLRAVASSGGGAAGNTPGRTGLTRGQRTSVPTRLGQAPQTRPASLVGPVAGGAASSPGRTPGSFRGGSGTSPPGGAAGAGRSYTGSTPLLSGLLDGEQFAQLIAASPHSQQRLTELLEEVNSEISKILSNAELDSSVGGGGRDPAQQASGDGRDVDGGDGSRGTAAAPARASQGDLSSRSHVGGSSAPSGSQGPRLRARPGRYDSQSGGTSSNARASVIVQRLCNRVDSLQSSLKVFEQRRRQDNSPRDMSQEDGALMSNREEESSSPRAVVNGIAGLSRLEDMLCRLESQVRTSFPVDSPLPPGSAGGAASSRGGLVVEVGELEQKKLTLEEEIALLIKQKQEMSGTLVQGSGSNSGMLGGRGTPSGGYPYTASTHEVAPTAGDPRSRTPLGHERIALTTSQALAAGTAGVPPSKAVGAAAASYTSPSSEAMTHHAPKVPPVPLINLTKATAAAAAAAAEPVMSAGTWPGSSAVGAMRTMGSAPKAPVTRQVSQVGGPRTSTPRGGGVGRETPPISPRQGAPGSATYTSTGLRSYAVPSLSARRLHKLSSGYPTEPGIVEMPLGDGSY